MAKTKQERIAKYEANIVAAEQRIQVEEAKINASRKKIRDEQKRISGWKAEILSCTGELLAEQFRASNLSLEDALAALDLQGEVQP